MPVRCSLHSCTHQCCFVGHLDDNLSYRSSLVDHMLPCCAIEHSECLNQQTSTGICSDNNNLWSELHNHILRRESMANGQRIL